VRRLFPLALVALSAASGAAAPTTPNPGATLRFMSGDCDRLAMPGARKGGCRPQLVNLVYASGAVSFVFTTKDGRLLSFRGRVDKQVGDQTRLKVDQVTLVTRGGGKFDTRPARGSCLLTPFAVERSRLDCTARAGATTFAGLFRTSDDAPKLLTLAGD
jgi:hypothetical protein